MDFLTPDDIGRKTGKSARWCVNNLLRTGEIPSFRLGVSWRVRPCDYEAWSERMAMEQEAPQLMALPTGRRRRVFNDLATNGG